MLNKISESESESLRYSHLSKKIFEYVLLEQITNYFLDNNMLSLQQYGFRSNHSTELAALNLVDELTYKLDRGIIPLNIYIWTYLRLLIP